MCLCQVPPQEQVPRRPNTRLTTAAHPPQETARPHHRPRTCSARRLPVTPPRSAPMMALGNTDPDRRAMDDATAAPDSSPARPVVRKKAKRMSGGGGGRARWERQVGARARQGRQAAGREIGARVQCSRDGGEKREEKKDQREQSGANKRKPSASRALPRCGIQGAGGWPCRLPRQPSPETSHSTRSTRKHKPPMLQRTAHHGLRLIRSQPRPVHPI